MNVKIIRVLNTNAVVSVDSVSYTHLKTRNHRNRILGSGITICVFDRSIGKLISIDSLFGKLVLLYWDQALSLIHIYYINQVEY